MRHVQKQVSPKNDDDDPKMKLITRNLPPHPLIGTQSRSLPSQVHKSPVCESKPGYLTVCLVQNAWVMTPALGLPVQNQTAYWCDKRTWSAMLLWHVKGLYP